MAGLGTKSPTISPDQKNARAQKWDEPSVLPIDKFAKSKHCEGSIFLSAHSMTIALSSLRLPRKFAKLGEFLATAVDYRDTTLACQHSPFCASRCLRAARDPVV
jgi:hypothetical protein